MMKRFCCFVTLLSCMIGMRAQTLVLHHPGGATTDVDLSLHPRIEFLGNRVVIKIPGQELSFANAEVLRLTHSGCVRGDVNRDGKMAFSDVTSITTYMLGMKPDEFNAAAADMNGDGRVDIADVTLAIDNLLSGSVIKSEKSESSSQGIGDAFYINRNGGQISAFFREDVDSIAYSHYDADSVYYDMNVMQLVYTSDSLYRIPLPAIDDVDFCVNDIAVSADYLPVSEEGYTIVSADVEGGNYVLEFHGELPRIESGCVMTIIGDGISEMVRVLDAQYNGQFVTITAEKASMGDVFTSGSFTLSTEQMATASRSKSFTSNGKRVYYPVEVSYYDEGNHRHCISSQVPRKMDFDHNLYHYTIDFSGHDFYKNDYVRLYLESCRLDLDLSLVISCNFNSLGEGLDKWRKGELAMQKSVIRGSVDTDFMIRFDASGSKKEDMEEIMLKKNLHGPITAKFIVAGVPVVVVMNTHLLADGSYEAEGNFSAYTGFATSTAAELGFSWSQASGLRPYTSFSNSFTMHDPTIEGGAHLEGKISVFPRITFSVYGLVGPSFDIKPYLRETLDIGFCDDVIASTEEDFYGSEYNLYAGYDAAVGLSFLSVTGNKPFVQSPSWNVAEAHVYEAPKNIEFEKASSDTIVFGQPVDVSFRVTDYLHILQNDCNAALPMAVKFETNSGKLKHDFAVVDISTGLATATWTPSGTTEDGKDAYIVAMMHDHNGRVITADRWTPENVATCPDNHHPHWIDLGLPSGTRWLCCNEGASSPEGFGGFYKFRQVSSAPSLGQADELLRNCSYRWVTQNGVGGGWFTGPSGASIFLPGAGWIWFDNPTVMGSDGVYWTSTSADSDNSHVLILHPGGAFCGSFWSEGSGRSVRPVR